MHDDFSFLRAIFNQPDDDILRLVYADWLDEHDDPRAAYVRLDVELHRLADGPQDPQDRHAALTKQMSDLTPKLDNRWLRWMSWTRPNPAGARLDLALVTNGKSLIDVRGGGSDTVLLVEGKPVAMNWDDCQGSVGQYLVFTGHTRGADHARQLAEFVEDEVDQHRPLADQIAPLLAVFAPGTYCLTYTPAATAETYEYSAQAGASRELGGYYPYDRNLICTQTRESLDESRVEYFRQQIRAKRQPIVLTVSAEGSWCEFVIDGHHKLAAYNRQRVKPTILGIYRCDAPEISLNEGIGYLPPRHPGISEYRRMKR